MKQEDGIMSPSAPGFSILGVCVRYPLLAMNAFPNGTRVFYWASGGEIKYGTVQATNRMADGTQIVVVKVDGDGHAQLPVSSLVKVNQ